jgi:hypothetical protein
MRSPNTASAHVRDQLNCYRSRQSIQLARDLRAKPMARFHAHTFRLSPTGLHFAAINGCMNADCGVNICSSFVFEMEQKRSSVEWIVAVLKQAELGVPVAEVIRKVEISEQTFYQ